MVSDGLCSPSSTLCLLGEGVSWIRNRRVCSEGSRAFQLSPAFFPSAPWWLPDVFKGSGAFALFLTLPSSVSLRSRILALFRDHTLRKSAHFTLSDRNHPSSNKQSFPAVISLLPLPSLLLSLSPSSFIAHHPSGLMYCRGKQRFSYNIADRVMFSQYVSIAIKCIGYTTFIGF